MLRGALSAMPDTPVRMARFHTLEVADIHHETADSISIGFRVPPELKADFSFIHGQYLTLKLIVNGTELRRSYSICSSPLPCKKPSSQYAASWGGCACESR